MAQAFDGGIPVKLLGEEFFEILIRVAFSMVLFLRILKKFLDGEI